MARFWPRRGDSSRNRVWNMHPVFRVADHAHCTRVVRRYELPCVVWLPFFIPALSRLPGHNPAQLAIFSAVGKCSQIHTCLCQNTCCCQLADARDGLESLERSLKWRFLHALQDLTVDLFDLFLKKS